MLIETRFRGPTDTKGSRITVKATGLDGNVIRDSVGYDHAIGSCANHERAAYRMAVRLGYTQARCIADLGRGYAYAAD